MHHVRVWRAFLSLALLVSASCAESGSDGSGDVLAHAEHVSASDGTTLAAAAPAAEPALATSSAPRRRLPGSSARTILHEEVNEAENLFFTEDGRLFVSGAEDIYEIKRAADGTFTKTDHFDEDCIVEGIVRSGSYLYGVCWNLLTQRTFFIAGELTDKPVFRTIAELQKATVPNGMTVDPEGRVYVTNSTTGQIVRLTLATPLELGRTEIWASDLPSANGIKYLNGAMYVTLLNASLVSEFVRIPVLPDGSAGKPERLYQRTLTLLDDIIALDDGFVITDFLKGTLIFWDERRGVYAETPAWTFFGPTSLAQGRPPMFTERQLIVAEKGTFLLRNERLGDLLSMYQLP